MKNLVIGFIKNYRFAHIKPFFTSLEKSGYRGDVAMVYDNLPSSTLAALKKRGVILIPFENHKDSLVKSGDKTMDLAKRFVRYAEFLAEHAAVYQYIMLTDVGDVVFQRDPFDFDIGDSLCCFLEQEGRPIKVCPKNSRWMKNTFGQEIFVELADRQISSAGVTIGSSQKVRLYLEEMYKLVTKLAGSQLNDQAVHNYVVYKNLVPNTKIFINNQGPVITLGYMHNIPFDVEGRIINKLGEVTNVIHQYPRHYRLAARYYSFSVLVVVTAKRFLRKVRSLFNL